VLVEREYFLASLTALLDEAVAGSGRFVFLGGEAGVGKTSLAAALAAVAPARVSVRRGGCDNLTTAAALGPIADALPELAEALESDTEVDRRALFGRLRSVLAAEPTLLLLEDVHWADEATLDLVRLLGRRLHGLPVLVLATYREEELSRTHPLTVALGDLATSPGVVRMRLLPLTLAGVRQLIDQAGSTLDAADLHRNTNGNAFYVTEVLAAGDQQLPATVRDAVLARAHRLSPAAQRALSAAAVLGPRSRLPLIAVVSGEAPDAIDECVHVGLLVADGDTLAFRHELGRLAIEQALSPGERAALHAAALRTLRAVGEQDHRRLAHHAAGCADAAAVLDSAPRAAARSARLGAHREAAELYRLALRAGEAPPARRADLCTALSYECYLTDQAEEALAARADAMQLSAEAGDSAAVGTAQRWLSRLSWFLGRNADSERWANRAVATLEPLGESSELAMAYSNLANLRMCENNIAEAVHWGERAIAMARRLGDREVEMHALINVGAAKMNGPDAIDGAHLLARSLDMALADDVPEHAARAYTNLGSAMIGNRRFAEGERQLRRGLAYCLERDLDSWRMYMTSWLARSQAEQGHYAAADATAGEVLRRTTMAPVTRIGAAVVAGLLVVRRGEPADGHFDEALALAKRTGESQRLTPVSAALAETAWLAGDLDAVVGAVDHAWPAAVRQPHPWELGELSWWLAVAGERRETPIPVATPFAAMLAGAWQQAADGWQRVGCPLWRALALAAAPDLAAARTALELVDELGAPAVRLAILRDRHALGLPVPRGPRPASQANTWGLTAREVEVLALLVDGLSNAELAQQLFLSEKTVGHHVSAILRKLGEPTRSRAVATALRQGIVSAS
jgi:DNA-binding CsgD family transcriptional regulator/tetratricopeptide (TPR) repeat protein